MKANRSDDLTMEWFSEADELMRTSVCEHFRGLATKCFKSDQINFLMNG